MLNEFENSKDLLPFAVLNPFLDILRTSGHLRPKIAPLFSRIADEIDRNKVPLPSNTIFFFLILTKRKTTLTPLTGESSCIDPIMDTYTRQNNCRGKGNCSFLVGAWTRGQCRWHNLSMEQNRKGSVSCNIIISTNATYTERGFGFISLGEALPHMDIQRQREGIDDTAMGGRQAVTTSLPLSKIPCSSFHVTYTFFTYQTGLRPKRWFAF